MHDLFVRFASRISHLMGSAWTFFIAIFFVSVWAITGPLFGFSHTWQLVINTGTTVITFLMVFIIQNTQNRDSKSINLKLDELIRSSTARKKLIDLEELSDEEMDKLQKEFRGIAEKRERVKDIIKS